MQRSEGLSSIDPTEEPRSLMDSAFRTAGPNLYLGLQEPSGSVPQLKAIGPLASNHGAIVALAPPLQEAIYAARSAFNASMNSCCANTFGISSGVP